MYQLFFVGFFTLLYTFALKIESFWWYLILKQSFCRLEEK